MNSDNQKDQSTSSPTIAQKLALWAHILRDCSDSGLLYAANPYDQERYRRVQDVALEMLATVADRSLEELEPLRENLFLVPSPFPVADAAVIGDEGKILLIRRADNGLWAMPGGGLDVGETPAQGAVREVLEETGVACEPVLLIGIYDSRFCGTTSLFQLYQFSFLCRPLPHIPPITSPSHAHEVLEVRWFPEDSIPEELDPGHKSRIPAAYRVWHGDHRAFFDPVTSPTQ